MVTVTVTNKKLGIEILPSVGLSNEELGFTWLRHLSGTVINMSCHDAKGRSRLRCSSNLIFNRGTFREQ